jgi:hypothetical protein
MQLLNLLNKSPFVPHLRCLFVLGSVNGGRSSTGRAAATLYIGRAGAGVAATQPPVQKSKQAATPMLNRDF